MKKILAPVAATALLFSATAAHADTRPAATSFSQPITDESELEGENGILIALLAAAAIIAGIIIISGGDDNPGSGNSPR